MSNRVELLGLQKYLSLAVRAFLTLALVAAGGAKLIGAEDMVALFESVGIGQWFRYATGGIEIIGAILLWISGRTAIGAGIISITMVGAIFTHLVIIGPSAVPATVLLILGLWLVWLYRSEFISK